MFPTFPIYGPPTAALNVKRRIRDHAMVTWPTLQKTGGKRGTIHEFSLSDRYGFKNCKKLTNWARGKNIKCETMRLFFKSTHLVHPCTPHHSGTHLENSGTPWAEPVLFNLWYGIRTSADKKILSRGWQTLCRRESSKNYQYQRPWESKVRDFELWADSTCEKSWRRRYFERTRERERKQCRKIISPESAESISPEVYFSR